MKQIVQLLVILAIIGAIVMYMQRHPGGFGTVKQETTTKTHHVKEGEGADTHHKAIETYKKK